jgi:hypothetical protein
LITSHGICSGPRVRMHPAECAEWTLNDRETGCSGVEACERARDYIAIDGGSGRAAAVSTSISATLQVKSWTKPKPESLSGKSASGFLSPGPKDNRLERLPFHALSAKLLHTSVGRDEDWRNIGALPAKMRQNGGILRGTLLALHGDLPNHAPVSPRWRRRATMMRWAGRIRRSSPRYFPPSPRARPRLSSGGLGGGARAVQITYRRERDPQR